MLKLFAHFLSAIFSMFLGFAIWIAPFVDWGNREGATLWDTRGLIILGMTTLCFATNILSMFDVANRSSRRKP